MTIYAATKLLPQIVYPLLVALCLIDTGTKSYLFSRHWNVLYILHAIMEMSLAATFGFLAAKAYTDSVESATVYGFIAEVCFGTMVIIVIAMQIVRWAGLLAGKD